MVLLLGCLLLALPKILQGKNPLQMMDTVVVIICGFAALGILVGLIGLVVWLRVLRGKRPRR